MSAHGLANAQSRSQAAVRIQHKMSKVPQLEWLLVVAGQVDVDFLANMRFAAVTSTRRTAGATISSLLGVALLLLQMLAGRNKTKKMPWALLLVAAAAACFCCKRRQQQHAQALAVALCRNPDAAFEEQTRSSVAHLIKFLRALCHECGFPKAQVLLHGVHLQPLGDDEMLRQMQRHISRGASGRGSAAATAAAEVALPVHSTRTRYALQFNSALGTAARSAGFRFVDISRKLLDEETGTVRETYVKRLHPRKKRWRAKLRGSGALHGDTVAHAQTLRKGTIVEVLIEDRWCNAECLAFNKTRDLVSIRYMGDQQLDDAWVPTLSSHIRRAKHDALDADPEDIHLCDEAIAPLYVQVSWLPTYVSYSTVEIYQSLTLMVSIRCRPTCIWGGYD